MVCKKYSQLLSLPKALVAMLLSSFSFFVSASDLVSAKEEWRYIGKTQFFSARQSDEMITNYLQYQRFSEPPIFESTIDDNLDLELSQMVMVDIETGNVYEQPIDLSIQFKTRAMKNNDEQSLLATDELEPSAGDERYLLSSRTEVRKKDKRKRYTNMTSYPHRVIGGIAAKGEQVSICTGTKVGPRHVLTAAHCVHPGGGGKNKFYSKRDFAPGWKGIGDDKAHKPNGHYKAIKYFAPKGWVDKGKARYDYAIIVLENKTQLRNLGHLGAREGKVGNLVQKTVRNRGYPIYEAKCEASPNPDKYCNNYMYGMSCKGLSVGAYQFSHNCYTQPGQSGSAIYKTDNRIYGIHTSGSLLSNWGVKIRSNMIDMIKSAKKKYP